MSRTKRAMVVVIGELARSPRMQYHCLSLANDNYEVSVIATGDRDLACDELEANRKIKKNQMSVVPKFACLPSSISYIIKPIWLSFLLIYQLIVISIYQHLPHVIIVQNPPSIPALPVLCLYSRLAGSKLIIDWHNYGYTILSLNLRSTHVLVRIYKSIEFLFGRFADAGFCVSEAMKLDLVNNHHILYPLCVLYDKPPKHFKPLSTKEKLEFYRKIKPEVPEFESILSGYSESTAVILSSTSWTEDEDFGLLLDALKRYDLIKIDRQLPKLVCVITGKGPLKVYFKRKIEECQFEHIQVALPWLSAADYPKMVGSCDLGISLHKSSSGVDLPMKVVDMFGCGVPVLAYNNNNEYITIRELVHEDVYGKTFRDSDNLFSQLSSLLKDSLSIDRYKKNINRQYRNQRWEANWICNAKPVLDELIGF